MRVEFTYAWEDEHGQPKHWMRVSVSFESVGNQTRLRMLHSGLESETAKVAHGEGWNSTFDRLDAQLQQLS